MMWRLIAPICVAMCVASAPASAQRLGFECTDWVAIETLPINETVTLIGTIRLKDDMAIKSYVILDGEGFETEIRANSRDRSSVAVFGALDGSVHLVLAQDGSAFAKIGDETETVFGGELLAPLEVIQEDGFRDRGGQSCVRVSSKPVLVAPMTARSMGIDLSTEIRVLPLEGSPRPDMREVFPDAAKPEVAEDEPKKGIGDVFASKTGTADPPVPDDPSVEPAKPDAVADVIDPPVDIIDTIVEEVVAEVAAVPPTICLPGQADPQPFADSVGAEGFTVAGLLADAVDLPAFRRLPGTDDLIPEDGSLALAARAASEVRRLALPFGLQTINTSDNNEIQPMRPVDATLVVSGEAGATSPPAVTIDTLLNLLVIGDADTTAVSGLDLLEQDLIAATGYDAWTVEWVRVMPDGQFASPVTFGSLREVVAAAAAEKGAYFAQDTVAFDKLMQGIEAALLTEGPVVHQVLLLQEGYQLPHSAPARFEAMILAVNDRGRIERFPDNRPRKWLQMIAGSFSTPFSESYLDGPIKTTGVGYLVTEGRAESGRTTILTDTSVPLSSLELALRRRAGELGVTTPQPPDPVVETADDALGTDVFFPRASFVTDLGLVVRQDMMVAFLQSLSATTTAIDDLANKRDASFAVELLDIAALMTLRTDGQGTLKPETLDARGLERSLKLLKLRRGEGFIDRLQAWQKSTIQQVAPVIAQTECGYFYFSVNTLVDG